MGGGGNVSVSRRVRVMVFNATFNNLSVILWWSVLLWRKPEYLKKTTDLPQTFSNCGSTKNWQQISQKEIYKAYKQFYKNKNKNFFYCCFHELKHVPSSFGTRNHNLIWPWNLIHTKYECNGQEDKKVLPWTKLDDKNLIIWARDNILYICIR